LENYLVQKYPGDMKKKPMNFEQWWEAYCSNGFWEGSCEECPGYGDALRIWKAAQENM
jgi:hypothetical protein